MQVFAEAAAQYPNLTDADLRRLIPLAQTGDERAMDQVCKSFFLLVAKLCTESAGGPANRERAAEFLSYGLEGLVLGIKTWKGRSAPPANWLALNIKWMIGKHISNQATHKKNAESFLSQIAVDQWGRAFDVPDNSMRPDIVPDEECRLSLNELPTALAKAGVSPAGQVRARRFIELRYGLIDDKPLSFAKIARLYQGETGKMLSPERVRQVIKQGLAVLRETDICKTR
jgi:hypothetical protein